MPLSRTGPRRILDWILLCTLGLSLAKLLALPGMPAAAMLGPLIIAAILALRGSDIRLPQLAVTMAHAMVGCLIAAAMDPGMLAQAVSLWPLILVFVTLTFAAAALTGLFAAKRTGIARDLTIWGFLPGLLGAVIEAAETRGIDSRMIALIQILRLVNVILAMVVLTALLSGPAIAPTPWTKGGGADFHDQARDLLLIAALVASGVAAARWLRFLPAAATLVPLVLTSVLAVSGVRIAAPGWMVALAFLGIGAGVGLRFTPALLRMALRALPGLTLASGLLILLCAASGLLLAWVANVSPLTGILATVPGSIDSLALLAIGAGADVSFIMTFQTVRLFAVALFGPALASFLSRKTR
ncbi:AbrB family transcriptional regulator [Paracoccus sp. IB05]|uniref:AbrB family transcriptional regulator n=1 Tax=Paracoccus sp. IB05 TaxID=2779367 RepID=UPI0018E6F324|nr:AbrB family transcriptional regulator [Paracoccus sp. IB05]MBJ2152845.1 AbrB family transcriptional regulator [Paracoccus sp. IB05]